MGVRVAYLVARHRGCRVPWRAWSGVAAEGPSTTAGARLGAARPSRPASPAARCRRRPMSAPWRRSTGPGFAGSSGRLRVSGLRGGECRGFAARHDRLPADRGARPLDRGLGAAGGAPLFRQPGGGDHADRLLWLPRPERQQLRQHLRARLRQRSGHGRLPARRTARRSSWSTPGGSGTPRERAFLQAVFAGACAEFYTVLGPGSDRYHYNHIHVDLLVSQRQERAAFLPAVARAACRWPRRRPTRRPTASIRPIPFTGPAHD